MVTLHHLENSRSQRILWLLEELEIPYEIKLYRRDPETSLAPPELIAVHPLGKSPVITDGDRTLAESGAIIEYLVENYGAGRMLPPPGSAEHLRYRYWLHYAEGSLMPFLLLSLLVRRIENAPVAFFVRPIARGIAGKLKDTFVKPNIDRHLAFLEQALAESPWFAGPDISGADVQMSFPLEAAAVRTDMVKYYPNLNSWLERIRSRPAYQRALAKGGPFKLPG
ncbi:MAG TPA: glutathione S-transferase [Woeseiaceae bacterium]|nr:glutathione S-transferase [Woeseiaceae bacterium]